MLTRIAIQLGSTVACFVALSTVPPPTGCVGCNGVTAQAQASGSDQCKDTASVEVDVTPGTCVQGTSGGCEETACSATYTLEWSTKCSGRLWELELSGEYGGILQTTFGPGSGSHQGGPLTLPCGSSTMIHLIVGIAGAVANPTCTACPEPE